ncbi:MAG: FHA domain-containing protein [Eubacterium sp.]|nr:FHA domain-containing protein [Eubacterium sp.]
MSLVISVFSKHAYRDYMLPSLEHADYHIVLEKGFFGLKNNLKVLLEVMDGAWSVRESGDYSLYRSSVPCGKEPLCDGDFLKLVIHQQADSPGETAVYLFVRENVSPFHPFAKYNLCLQEEREIRIGRNSDNHIIYDIQDDAGNSFVSRFHARIVRRGDGLYFINESGNGSYVNRVRLERQEETGLDFGDQIQIMGLHMVCLGDMIAIDSQMPGLTVRTGDGLEPASDDMQMNAGADQSLPSVPEADEIYRPRPVLWEKRDPDEDIVEIKCEAAMEEAKADPVTGSLAVREKLFLAALPGAAGLGLMAFPESSAAGLALWGVGLGLILLSVLIMALAVRMEKTRHKKLTAGLAARREEKRKQLLDRAEEQLSDRYEEKKKELALRYPSADFCSRIGREAGGGLWERVAGQEDFLSFRLGTGSIPSGIRVAADRGSSGGSGRQTLISAADLDEINKNFAFIKDVPVTVNLNRFPRLGIEAGDDMAQAYSIMRALSVQIASACSYNEVRMVYIYDGSLRDQKDAFAFAGWLPHVWSGNRKIRYIGSDEAARREILYDLTHLMKTDGEDSAGKAGGGRDDRHYVFFVTDPDLLPRAWKDFLLQENSEERNVHLIMLSDAITYIYEHCDGILYKEDGSFFFRDLTFGEGRACQFLPDSLDAVKARAFAGRITGIRVKETGMAGEIPDSLSFLDMYQVSGPSGLPVREWWAKNNTADHIRIPLGLRAGGELCQLDLHEKYHGPHGLIAGTTGSGKSELLAAFILSLALQYSPDDVSIFMIDYKGGIMSRMFTDLPHMAGQISNLSGNQAKRAMIAIKSENRRRQRILAEHRISHIDNYTALYREGKVKEPLPHLFLIVDEFAELRKEEPDFLKELISVAQVGRSLGVHLILSTQRLEGTVNDNILTNARFRLCLRMQDRRDSEHMIGHPDAAYLTKPGRCILQIGNDEVYEQFQSAYCGEIYNETLQADRTDESVSLLRPDGRPEITAGHLRMQEKGEGLTAGQTMETQLSALVRYIKETAERDGYGKARPLWPPLLPEVYPMPPVGKDALPANESGREFSIPVTIGRFDDPAGQCQPDLVVDFAGTDNIAVFGSVSSGKSTFLQTLAYGLVSAYSPETVNLCLFDFSSSMLTALEPAAHVRGIVTEFTLDAMGGLLGQVEEELAARKEMMRGGSFLRFRQEKGRSCPALIMMIDDFGAMNRVTENVYLSRILRIAREGVNYGIYMAVTGGGISHEDLPPRLAASIRTVFCLQLPSRYDYVTLLHDTKIDLLPEQGVRGRGLARYGSEILEFQTALAGGHVNDFRRMEWIRSDIGPGSADRTEEADIDDKPGEDRWKDLIGAGPEDFVSLKICGLHKKGKETFLNRLIKEAADRKSCMVLIDRPDGTFTGMYADDPRVLSITDSEELYGFLAGEEGQEGFIRDFSERNRKKHALEEAGEPDLFLKMQEVFEPVFIILPDPSLLEEMIEEIAEKHPAYRNLNEHFSRMVEVGLSHNIYYFMIMNDRIREKMAAGSLREAFDSHAVTVYPDGTGRPVGRIV